MCCVALLRIRYGLKYGGNYQLLSARKTIWSIQLNYQQSCENTSVKLADHLDHLNYLFLPEMIKLVGPLLAGLAVVIRVIKHVVYALRWLCWCGHHLRSVLLFRWGLLKWQQDQLNKFRWCSQTGPNQASLPSQGQVTLGRLCVTFSSAWHGNLKYLQNVKIIPCVFILCHIHKIELPQLVYAGVCLFIYFNRTGYF